MGLACKYCGCNESEYIRKDVGHVGEYCINCKKWKKWISKKEQVGKQIIENNMCISTVSNIPDVPDINCNTIKYDKPETAYNGLRVNSTCSDMSDIASSMSSTTKPLQINIAPRGLTTVTVSTGETVELTGISIRVNKQGVTILDFAGNQLKSFKF